MKILRCALCMSVMAAPALGCSSAIETNEPTGQMSVAVASCPVTPSPATDDVQRAAATIAFNIMTHAASVNGTMPMDANVRVAQSALAPQRYRLKGPGIEFDPTDPLYASFVTDDMKADLEYGQQDPAVATFLAEGLQYDYCTMNGVYYAGIRAIPALDGYVYPGPAKASIPDKTAASHLAEVTGAPGDGGVAVNTITETVVKSWEFAPLLKQQIFTWRTSPPKAFKYNGPEERLNTPFNGPYADGNPYLIVSVDGVTTSWSKYDFIPISCYSKPNFTCTSTIELDPAPYAEPAPYYNDRGLVGTHENPFELNSAYLFAVPEHRDQWATKTAGGVQEWGQFSTEYTILGKKKYKYDKKE